MSKNKGTKVPLPNVMLTSAIKEVKLTALWKSNVTFFDIKSQKPRSKHSPLFFKRGAGGE